jgi:hypothetical protein
MLVTFVGGAILAVIVAYVTNAFIAWLDRREARCWCHLRVERARSGGRDAASSPER